MRLNGSYPNPNPTRGARPDIAGRVFHFWTYGPPEKWAFILSITGYQTNSFIVQWDSFFFFFCTVGISEWLRAIAVVSYVFVQSVLSIISWQFRVFWGGSSTPKFNLSTNGTQGETHVCKKERAGRIRWASWQIVKLRLLEWQNSNCLTKEEKHFVPNGLMAASKSGDHL